MDSMIEYNTSSCFEMDKTLPLCVNNAGHYIVTSRNYPTNRPTGRDDYQIIYVVKGTMEVIFDKKKQTVSEGTLIIYRPHEPQNYTYCHKHHCEAYWIHFYGTMIPDLFKELNLEDVHIINIGIDYKIPKYINGAMTDLIVRKFGFEQSCMGYLLHLLSTIAYHNGRASKDVTSFDTEKFYEVLLSMQDASTNISLDKYANMCNMSISRFSHSFKETFGVSPHYYQTKIKIDKAKSLLESSNLSIKEISSTLGYEDTYYFSRIFKKYVHKSPKKFRDDSRNSNFSEEENLLDHITMKDGIASLPEEEIENDF